MCSGLDYADQRYYASANGRFNTADPAGMHAANLKNPGSWNQYAYTMGDPINLNDPLGFDGEGPSYCDIYGPIDPHCNPNYCPQGICDADGDPGNGVPTCADFKKTMGWSDQQWFDASVIVMDSSRLGLMLGGFSYAVFDWF
jgi:RHS repeat-associated protein